MESRGLCGSIACTARNGQTALVGPAVARPRLRRNLEGTDPLRCIAMSEGVQSGRACNSVSNILVFGDLIFQVLIVCVIFTRLTHFCNAFLKIFSNYLTHKKRRRSPMLHLQKTLCDPPRRRDYRICKLTGVHLGGMHWLHCASSLPMRSRWP